MSVEFYHSVDYRSLIFWISQTTKYVTLTSVAHVYQIFKKWSAFTKI